MFALALLGFDLLLVIGERRAKLTDLELEIAGGALRRFALEERLLLVLTYREPRVDLVGGGAVGLGEIRVRFTESAAPFPKRDLFVRRDEAHLRLVLPFRELGGQRL